MAFHRRAGAPRLIDWTGERCVPWAPDAQVVYEHFHRYLWARQFARGRRVLDLASGEGFGAAILAEVADWVVGIDVDEPTVQHSQLNYGGDSLSFLVADASDLSHFDAGSFDLVVAFEMIEHVEDQTRVLGEVSRVLVPDGLLVMSTPDRVAYSDAAGQRNPFHLRELTAEEFQNLLQSRFANVSAWGQRSVEGSAMSQLRGERSVEGASTFTLGRRGDEWGEQPGISPLYVIALASHAALPAVAPQSVLSDGGMGLLRATEDRDRQQLSAALSARDEREQAAQQHLAALQEQFDSVALERDDLRRRLELRTNALADRRREIEYARQRVHELGAALTRVEDQAEALRIELAEARRLIWRVEGSVLWQGLQRARGRFYGALGGENSLLARGVQRGLRLAGRSVVGADSARRHGAAQILPSEPPIEFPQFEHPQVSMIIPVHRHANLTRRCLESIRDNTHQVSYEVIIADDAADQATRAVLGAVRGAKLLVNGNNLGYLRTVNSAAKDARGEWLVLCNNDIEVQDGWLEALVECAENDPAIGVVAPRYLAPDGTVSEAGAIIWRDGTGWNYGRGGDPGHPHWSFRREIDYGSAAALLVSANLWRQVDGFDERFLPMYFEDVDLCFQAREAGYKVVYEPAAVVVHVEGASAGTDIATGHKRHQELNRSVFVAKWREQLAAHMVNDPGNVAVAANRHLGPRVLIVDYRVPPWDHDAGALRMRGIIDALIALGCHVTFFPDNLHPSQPYTRRLQSLGVQVLYGDIDIRDEVRQLAPNLSLVLSCRPHSTSRWLDLVRAAAPLVPVVYDTVDLHWVREARKAGVSDWADERDLPPVPKALRELELAMIRATDATIVVTENERQRVLADVPDADVRVVPTVHDVSDKVPLAAARSGVLFVGSFEHVPNVDAAVNLVQQVMPRVWSQIGPVHVRLVGASAPAAVLALAGPMVEVTGWVEDLFPLLASSRLLVAPLTYGAGLKGKITQALAAGLPVVTTSIGAEGIAGGDGEVMLIASSPEDLAARVILGLTDDELWERLSTRGRAVAMETYSPKVMTDAVRELLNWSRRGAVVRPASDHIGAPNYR